MDGINGNSIGMMLRRARQERNLTLEKLSRLSRVPPSTIWKYENEKVDYSFMTVLKLASALNKSFSYFLGQGNQNREDVVAAGPDDGVSCRVTSQRWCFDLFNRRLVGRWMVNGLLRLYPGAEVHPKKSIENEVFLNCLRGTVEVDHGEGCYTLTRGCSIQFRTNEPVSLRNRGDQDAVAMLSAACFPFVI